MRSFSAAIFVLLAPTLFGFEEVVDEVILLQTGGAEISLGATAEHAAKAKVMDPAAVPETKAGTQPAVDPAMGIVFIVGALVLLVIANIAAGKEPSEDGKPSTFSMIVAEFIGTFMLVLSVGCIVLIGDATWGVVGIACTLMVMIYSLGGISGGNFNPAVSIGLFFAGKMSPLRAFAYSCAQTSAGILAGHCYGYLLGKTIHLAPADGVSLVQAGLAELLYTFMLVFVVLNTACSKKHAGKEQFYGLAIGFVVVAGGYSAGALSGGCFNPAVALGLDSSGYRQGFGWFATYWAFEILGSFLATVAFRICRPEDYDSESNSFVAKLFAEFLGTFFLVLTVGLNVLAASKAAVFSIAASLMCMIFALGSFSGAHFNPAVTYAIYRRGAMEGNSIIAAVSYMGAQIVGAICAAFTYGFLRGEYVPLSPTGNEAYVGEFAFTFLLAFTVLCVATRQSPLSEYFGLAIGSCVTAGGLAIGSLSGGCLNPAVSAGLSVTSGTSATIVYYFAAQFLAGEVAAQAFKITYAAELSQTKS